MVSLVPFLHFSTTAVVAGALFASLWQGSLLVLIVSLVVRCLPGLTASARAAIWAAVLLVIAVHPVLAFYRGGAAAAGGSSAGLVHAEFGFSVALVGVWAMASLFRLFQLLISGAELWRTLRSARPLGAPAEVAALLRESPRRPELCSSELVNRPCVAGFLRPRLLLPADLLPGLKESELLQIALHELEHLRRGDDWVNLLQQVALVVLPLHPGMLWVNRRLALERELACDDAVLAATRAGKAYAACLAHVAEQSLIRRGLTLAVGALGSWRRRSELTARVERILRTPERTLSGVSLRVTTGLVLAVTVFAGGALGHSPTLVSFGPEASPAMAVMGPISGAQMLPVVSREAGGRGHVVPHAALVKAVMPGLEGITDLKDNNGGLPPATVRRVRRARVERAGLRHHGHGATAPWMRLTSWDLSNRAANSAYGIGTRWVPVAYAPPLQRAVVETQQVWYTAIRYGDGWLVVQL